MSDTLKPPARPCGSCPYRRDVPSRVWAPEEYEDKPFTGLRWTAITPEHRRAAEKV